MCYSSGVMRLEVILALMKEIMETGEAPPVGTQWVRAWLMGWDGESEVPELVSEWVARREEALLAGAGVIEALEERHRTPNYHDVVENSANFPPWHHDPAWQMLCFHPWSEKYEESLAKCREYLDQ